MLPVLVVKSMSPGLENIGCAHDLVHLMACTWWQLACGGALLLHHHPFQRAAFASVMVFRVNGECLAGSWENSLKSFSLWRAPPNDACYLSKQYTVMSSGTPPSSFHSIITFSFFISCHFSLYSFIHSFLHSFFIHSFTHLHCLSGCIMRMTFFNKLS